jgi:hypothetical protein
MNYSRTLITVADDCPVTESVAPPDRGANKTVASLQHAMLVDSPYVYTQEDVLFITWFERQTIPHMPEEDIAHLRDEFFAKPQACLRASPLPKRYGWGCSSTKKAGWRCARWTRRNTRPLSPMIK